MGGRSWLDFGNNHRRLVRHLPCDWTVQLITAFKRVMRRLTPLEVAARELSAAQLALLEAHTGQEYAAALVAFNKQRVQRLQKSITAFLNEVQDDN